MYLAFASLYAALGDRGISPAVAKRMEVWEAAAAIGVGRPDPRATAPPGRSGGRTKSQSQQESHDLLRQRVLASQGLADAPVPAATSSEEVNAMMMALSIPSK